MRPKCQDVPKTSSDFEATDDVRDLSTARHRQIDVCDVPRTSSRVRGHGSGPSAACRPFWEPSSRTDAAPELAPELARRRADRGTTDFFSRRGRRRGSPAAGAGRWRPAGRSRRRSVPPTRHRSSRGDGRTAVLRTSGSCRGRRRGSLVLGHYLRQLKGSWAFHERQEGSYEDRRLQRQPKPPLWPPGTLGCKKRAKRQPQREVLTTRLQNQGNDSAGTL